MFEAVVGGGYWYAAFMQPGSVAEAPRQHGTPYALLDRAKPYIPSSPTCRLPARGRHREKGRRGGKGREREKGLRVLVV